MAKVMSYNSDSGELICYAPLDEMVLCITEPDFSKAHDISAAIQKAYRKGSILGRLEMQRSIESHMDTLNAS